MPALSVFEKVLLLQDLDFFSLAHTEHLTDFAALCEVHETPKGSVLFRKGELCLSLYLLVRGKVTLQSGSGTTETAEKDVLDCRAFFAQRPHEYTAQSVEDCTILTVGFPEFEELVIAEPEFCWAVTRSLALQER